MRSIGTPLETGEEDHYPTKIFFKMILINIMTQFQTLLSDTRTHLFIKMIMVLHRHYKAYNEDNNYYLQATSIVGPRLVRPLPECTSLSRIIFSVKLAFSR